VSRGIEDSKIYQYLASLTHDPESSAIVEYKTTGGKVIGCLYNQVPDELITAAGMLAYRPRAVGSQGDELAEVRFTQVNCSLVRNFYDSAKRGRFDFMDGLVVANSCDHVRKLYENWKDAIGLPYGYLICFPKRNGDAQVDELAKRLKVFKRDFENHFSVEIDDASLRAAIELHNKIRLQQQELSELRALPEPKLTGSQFMNVMIAGTCMQRDKYSELLSDLIEECKEAPGISSGRARVIIYGGEIDEVGLLEAIESQGALIVGDSLGSFGTRAFDYQVSTEGDLLHNLAKALLQDRQGEPRIYGTREGRSERVKQIMEDCKAQGVIQVHIPICDLWSYERMMFDVFADNNSLPCLDLDTEYVFAAAGQTKTRVQAFVETLTEGGR